MLNSAHRKWLIVIATCAFAVTACGKKEPPSPLTDTSGLLRYVPADSPYVLGALAPAPDDFIEKMEPKIDKVLISYRGMLRAIVAQAAAHEGDEDAPDAETMAMIEGVLGEMASLLSMEDLRAAGITSESTAVLYGVGLLPVLRLTLSDSALLEDAISRIEEKAGQSLPVGLVAGKNYRYFDAEEIRIVFGTFDDQLVLTVIPASFEAAQLEEALGLRLPAKSIAETGLLQEIAEEYGYLPEYIGFVSTERVADTFLDEPTGLNADLLALFDYDASGLSDVCRAEIRSLAAVMPRIVTGYSEI